MSSRYYLTTAIPYVNAPPHIGHALLFVYADVMARFQRLQGKEVRFLTGTDEHGQKIAQNASAAGADPKTFTDRMSQNVRDMAEMLEMSQTDFVRTTEPRHRTAVEAFWPRVAANGYLYKKRYGGLYCVGCESFKTEKDLVDGICPDHKTKPEYIEEENWFFKLSAFREKLLALYAAHPDLVVPETRYNEMKRLVEQGLEDMSISRSKERLSWGIPVPGDEGQVIYVWFDALINYLTGAGFGSDEAEVAQWWPCDAQFLGQEINRFHSILWAAMLMAADLPVPKRFYVHGWITVDGQKMSKTIGNVIKPKDLVDRFGADAMRFLLCREFPFASDGDYSASRFMARYDADLANNFGNLAHRTVHMLAKYRGGKMPAAAVPLFDVADIRARYAAHMERAEYDQALQLVWTEVVDRANKLVEERKPWALAKEGKDAELDETLAQLLEALRLAAWFVQPFIPATSAKLLAQLGQSAEPSADVFAWGRIAPGTEIAIAPPLFPRIEEGAPTA